MHSTHTILRSLFLITGILISSALLAQAPPKREVRAAWVSTVANLDWPSSRTASPATQRAELSTIFDQLRQAGINTILLQVRTECDALYDSPHEPWSYWLTGSQGTPPSPYYDPLAFAVQEAHKRGMELHAWLNPYRAVQTTGYYPLAASHVSVQHPSWVISIGTFKFLNPGLPEVRSYVSSIVADIVRRYDIDGIHFDDYFYPYPPNGITTQDDGTYAQYPRGISNRGDWRRDNVNLLIRAVHDSIQAFKPYLRFGISPFGIWRSGYPSTALATTTAYGDLYADVLAWVRAGDIDYVTPQLYWAIGSQTSPSYPHNTDYAVLMPWWSDSIAAHGRQFYPGHAAYRMSASSSNWPASEVLSQMRLNRQNPRAQGSVFFRAQMGLNDNLKGLRDSLKSGLYRTVALPPVMAWKDAVPPNPPRGMRFAPLAGTGASALQWDLPITAADGDSANRYVIYAFSRIPAGADLADAANIHAVVNTRSFVPPAQAGGDTWYYCVTALDRNNNESDTSAVIRIGAPTAPMLISPPTASTGLADTTRMVWSPTLPASSYHLQVAKDSLFAGTRAVDDSTVTDTSRTLAGLEGFTTYYWRVRAINSAGRSSFTSARSLTTGFPVAPVLVAPANLAVSQPPSLSLCWAPVATATTYRVQLSLVTDFATLVRDTAGIADTSLAIGGLASNTIYNWRVRASGALGTGAWSGMFRFRTAVQTGVEPPELPAAYALEQNFPNPFNPATNIRFTIPRESHVRLTVFDLLGREVTTLLESDLPAGSYTIRWDASDVASGMYVIRMTSGDVVQSRRMLLLR